MYFVYVLKSAKDNGWYIGYTSNLDNRLLSHNKGRVKSTKSRRPFVVIYSEKFQSKTLVEKAEKYYKSGAGRKKMREMISGYQ